MLNEYEKGVTLRALKKLKSSYEKRILESSDIQSATEFRICVATIEKTIECVQAEKTKHEIG